MRGVEPGTRGEKSEAYMWKMYPRRSIEIGTAGVAVFLGRGRASAARERKDA